MTARGLILLLFLGSSCRATTGRPPFDAFPEAETVELGFEISDPATTVQRVTDTVAAYLAADSIPLKSVKPFDGYIESAWFDSAARVARGRPSLGLEDVKVRVFVGPSKPGYARVELETVFRPTADPSLPARELERPVPLGHPINRRMAGVLDRLKAKYGLPSDESEPAAGGRVRPPPIAEPVVPNPAAKPDTIVAPPDTASKPDSIAVGPDPATNTDAVRTVPDLSAKPAPIATTPDPPGQPDTLSTRPDTTATAAVPRPPASADQAGFWVQVAALPSTDGAAELQASVESLGYSAAIKREGGYVKVRAGPFRTRAAATAARAKLKAALGGEPFLVVVT